jgi:hypothetical protein
MPFRLNLLAEAQAAEDMRRRDPVKRAIWGGVLLLACLLVWSSSVQLKAMLANSDLSRVEAQLGSHTNAYQQVIAHEARASEIKARVGALKLLAANRFLNGTLLNALQQTTAPDVQLIRMHVEQTYAISAATRPSTNNNRVTPGRPASSTENIVLTLEGNDTSPNPGDQISKLKDAIACNAYFKDSLARTNPVTLKSLSSLEVAPLSGTPCVLFTLECRYAERSR